MQAYDVLLDTSGLFCPQPLLHTKQALQQLQPGQILQIISTDPAAIIDFRVFAATTQHQIIEVQKSAGQYHFWLKKALPGRNHRG